MTNLDKCEKILNSLELAGFDRAELPGPGDLADAISEAGYVLLKENGEEDEEEQQPA